MLKNILSLLLSKFYSKKESGDVAKQSYPSTSATTIQLSPSDGLTNKELSYTPPSDGYIVLRDTGLPQSSSYIISGQYAEGVARGDNILFDFLTMTPVLKGVPVTIRYCGKDSVAQFIKNIGGVSDLKNALLQGGGLCLNSLSSSLRRSSLSVRRHGSATNLKLSYLAALTLPLLRARIIRTIPRQMMVLCVSTLRMRVGLGWHRQAIRSEEFCSILPTLKEFTNSSYFRLPRERLFTSTSLLTKPPLVSSSFRPLVPNVAKGGASC